MRTPPITAPTTVPVLTKLPSADVVWFVVFESVLIVMDTIENIVVKVFVKEEVPDAEGVTRVWFPCCDVENINLVVDLVITIEYGSGDDSSVVGGSTDIDDDNVTMEVVVEK